MQNDEKKTGTQAPQGDIVSAELLEEEYEKRSVMSAQGSLKKEKKKGGPALKIILALVVVAAVVGGFLFSRNAARQDEEALKAATPEPTKDMRVQIIDRAPSDFDYVTITLEGGESYTLDSHAVLDQNGQITGTETDADTTFEVVGKPGFALNPTVMISLIRYSTAMTVSRLVAENVTDLASYGLDRPTCRAEIHYKNNAVTTLLFGSAVPTTDNNFYYLTLEGTGKVYMAYALHYSLFNAPLNSRHSVPSNTGIPSANDVDKLYVLRPGAEPLEIVHREDSDDYLTFTTVQLAQPFVSDASAERVSELFEAAIGITMDAYAGTMEELQDVSGLGEEQRTVVRVTSDSGDVMVYYVGNVAEDGKHTYVAIDDNAVFLALTSSVDFISKCTPQYVIDQFSGMVYIARVDAVQVDTPTDSYKMTIQRTDGDDGKTKEAYFFDGESVEEKTFKKLYQEVIGSLVSKVSDDFHLTGDTVLKITYTLNVDPGEYVVEFITYDDDYYAVRRADGLTAYLIKKDKVAAIADAMAKMRSGEFTGS